MKCVYLLTAMVVMVVAEPDYYPTVDDNLDIDAIFADPPTMMSFLDCFMDRGPCTSLGVSYKQNMQDSVMRACDRCTFNQKQRFAKSLYLLSRLLPQEYMNFREKYDPLGIYFDRLEAELAQYLDYDTLQSRPYYYLYNQN